MTTIKAITIFMFIIFKSVILGIGLIVLLVLLNRICLVVSEPLNLINEK